MEFSFVSWAVAEVFAPGVTKVGWIVLVCCWDEGESLDPVVGGAWG